MKTIKIMGMLKITVLAGVVGLLVTSSAIAQITVYRPSYAPVIVPGPVAVPLAPVIPTT